MTDRRRIFVAAPYEPIFLDLLGGDSRFEVVYEPCWSEGELVSAVGESDILVTRYHNRITRAVIDAAPRLELIVQGTSGLDNIDHEAVADRGIRVLGVPGVNADAVAELVVGQMIALTRTVRSYDLAVREGGWPREDCATRRELRAYRLGILGLGRVGTKVSRLAAAFGMRVTAYDPYITDADFAERGASRVSALHALLEASDILTLHVPLTAETRGMIGGAELDRLPPRAIVINCSRGAVLDLRALLDRLESDRLVGAALDVFDPEPPAGIVWPDDPRLVLTPHVAGCTREAKESVGRMVYEALAAEVGRGG